MYCRRTQVRDVKFYSFDIDLLMYERWCGQYARAWASWPDYYYNNLPNYLLLPSKSRLRHQRIMIMKLYSVSQKQFLCFKLVIFYYRVRPHSIAQDVTNNPSHSSNAPDASFREQTSNGYCSLKIDSHEVERGVFKLYTKSHSDLGANEYEHVTKSKNQMLRLIFTIWVH